MNFKDFLDKNYDSFTNSSLSTKLQLSEFEKTEMKQKLKYKLEYLKLSYQELSDEEILDELQDIFKEYFEDF